eukprot:scaffold332545_cov19-Prasinocladus_malaysianus.AAC.1
MACFPVRVRERATTTSSNYTARLPIGFCFVHRVTFTRLNSNELEHNCSRHTLKTTVCDTHWLEPDECGLLFLMLNDRAAVLSLSLLSYISCIRNNKMQLPKSMLLIPLLQCFAATSLTPHQ